jgi:hypothetical protein
MRLFDPLEQLATDAITDDEREDLLRNTAQRIFG